MDQLFNHDVADWISKSMSRMDDDEAEMFAQFFVYEVHKQDIENNRRTLDRHVNDIEKSIWADLSPQIRELISKASWDGPDTPWEELYGKPQPRERRGRWVKIGFEAGGKPVTVTPKRGRMAGKQIDLTTSLNRAGQAGSAFSDRWTASGPNDASTNERTYRRIAAGAELLEHLPSGKAKAAAQVGQFVGQFGPEAEKVIGPVARRTAYRYRGTERMPDAKLLTYQAQAIETELKRTHGAKEFKRVSGGDTKQIAWATTQRPDLSPEVKMAASEQAAVGYLFKRLPIKGLSTLHRESGKLPPSEGVIINADGDIVTQAVGYNEDHYLPFNLKNLKGLKGGSYVRTRSTGGLTTEDIYTGLISGARSVTVVSRSGVFTLDFEDDLRGGRRYSDKARQMIGRYAQTLDAVQSKKVTRRGLTPDERAEVREEVEAEMEGRGYKASEIEAKIAERELEFSRVPQLTTSELDEINTKAMEAVQSGKGPRGEGTERFVPKDPKKAYNYYRSEFMDAAMETKRKRMYQLDAEGYEAAMNALKEQFPYYVANVQVKRYRETVPSTEEDTGYVRPRYNRPKAVRAGYFDEDITGRGKFSAADLHYQNYGVRAGGNAAEAGKSEAENKAGFKAVPLNAAAVKATAHLKERRLAALKKLADDADRVASQLNDGAKQYPALTRYRTQSDLSVYSAADIDKLVDEVKRIEVLIKGNDEALGAGNYARYQEALRTFDREDRALKSEVPFERSEWNPAHVDEVPRRFAKTEEHFGGHPASLYQNAMQRVISEGRIRGEVSPSMSDEQLQPVQKKWGQIYAAAKAFKDSPNAATQVDLEEKLFAGDFTEAQVSGLRKEVMSGNMTGVDKLLEESEKKALAVMELRSIKQASLQASDESASALNPGTAATTIQSVVVKPQPAAEPAPAPSGFAERLRETAASTAMPGIKKGLIELADALDHGTSEQAVKALNNLPDDVQSHYSSEFFRELRKRPS